jgi:hypothetical protein
MVGPTSSLISRFGMPFLKQAGITAGIQGLFALGNAGSQQAPARSGSRGQGRGLRFRPSGTGLANLGEEYKEGELLAGAAAEAFRPGAGFPGQQQFPGAPADPLSQLSPQDRAYQQERARVEAMVKSNPDMQKEEIAAARARVRDQGMEAWAKENPTLAKKVMPGQSGFSAIQGVAGQMPAPSFNPLMQQTFGYQTGGAPDQQIGAPTTGPTPAVLQVDQVLNPANPTFIGGEGAPIFDFTKDNVTPELVEKLQQQLLKQAS